MSTKPNQDQLHWCKHLQTNHRVRHFCLQKSNGAQHKFLFERYIHLGLLLTPVSCEDVGNLVVAADHFLIHSLKVYCIDLLKKNIAVESVWSVLNKVLKVNLLDVAESCSRVKLNLRFIGRYPKPKYSTALNLARVLNLAQY